MHIQNPYSTSTPNTLCLGRENILSALEQAWSNNRKPKPFSLLIGHRRMGKTSIILKAQKQLKEIHIAFVNALHLASSKDTVDVIQGICWSIEDDLKTLAAPDEKALTEDPYNAFQIYLQSVIEDLRVTSIVIVIDEYEKLGECLEKGILEPDFLRRLRKITDSIPEVHFAFSGLHTWEETFPKSDIKDIIVTPVGLLTLNDTKRFLATSIADQPVEWDDEAMERIFQLTAGHPAISGLIGMCLIHALNDQNKTGAKKTRLTVKDVDTVISNGKVFSSGQYIFSGIWQQAGRNISGQQDILKALSTYPSGVDLGILKSAIDLETQAFESALAKLRQLDVIKLEAGHVYIAVELFRCWILRQ